MNKRIILSLALFSFITSFATGLKFDNKNVRASESLGKVKLFHSNKNGFLLKENGNLHRIPNSSLSTELRNKTNKQLGAFQKAGYISVNKQSDGEFSLKSHVRGEAGGPGLAAFLYWTVKGVSYGVIALGGGAIIAAGPVGVAIAGGGAAGAAAGTATAATGIALSTVATTASLTSITVGAAATGGAVAAAAVPALVAGAVTGALGTAGAATATAAVTAGAVTATTAATIAGSAATVGWIESMALAAWAIGMGTPTV